MKDLFLKNSINFVQKYNLYSDKDIELIKYGLEGLYLTITKTLIIILVSIILGVLKEVIYVLIFFNIIRFTAFGFHASKSSICLITSLLLLIGFTLLFFNIEINYFAKIIICFTCIINYLLFAPADTGKRPLTNKKKRLLRKVFSIITATIYSIIIIFSNNIFISKVLLIALIIEALMINPIMYKLFKMPYNNYKKNV